MDLYIYIAVWFLFMQKFLVKFGYLPQAIVEPHTQISHAEMGTMLKVALTDFQKFYGLSLTGKTKIYVCIYMSHN
jgi:hypothetical protein